MCSPLYVWCWKGSWNFVYDVFLNTVIPCLHFVISVFQLKLFSWFDDYRKKDQFSIKTLLSQKNPKWSNTGLWQRVSTKKQKKFTKKSPSVPERKKERKNERNLLSIFFQSQYDTFQCLTSRGRAAARRNALTLPRAIRVGPNHGQKKIRVQYRVFIGIFSIPGVYLFFFNTGVYQSCH